MFGKLVNTQPDINFVSGFIEKPSQNCSDEDLTIGINQVLILLDKNPQALMNILAGHPLIPGGLLLDDLVYKMMVKNCVERLEPLFKKCLPEVVEACIASIHDLKRFATGAHLYLNEALALIEVDHELRLRFLENSPLSQEELEEFTSQYPSCKDQLQALFDTYSVTNVITKNLSSSGLTS